MKSNNYFKEHRGKFIDIGSCGGVCLEPSTIAEGSLHVNEETDTTCVPTKFRPLTLNIADRSGYFSEVTIENGIIEQCSCVTITKVSFESSKLWSAKKPNFKFNFKWKFQMNCWKGSSRSSRWNQNSSSKLPSPKSREKNKSILLQARFSSNFKHAKFLKIKACLQKIEYIDIKREKLAKKSKTGRILAKTGENKKTSNFARQRPIGQIEPSWTSFAREQITRPVFFFLTFFFSQRIFRIYTSA